MKKLLLSVLVVLSFSSHAESLTKGVTVDLLQKAYERDLKDILVSPTSENTKELLVRHRKTVECMGMYVQMNEKIFMNMVYDFEKMLRDPVIRQMYLKQMAAIEDVQMGWDPDETSCRHVVAPQK